MGDLPKERWWSHCNGRPTQMKDVGLIMMGELPKWKMLVSLLWVTYPEKVMVSLWWVTYLKKDGGLIVMGDLPRWKMLVSLWWVTYPNKRCWSHCYGWPTQIKDVGLIVMGDLPRKSDGLIVMGDLPKWKMVVSLWWVTYPEKDGLIMMGDLPRWNDQNMNWSHCYGWPTQMEDGLIVMGDLPRRMMVRAQRHTRKEVGLENALPEKWGLKGALKKR
jgi:hypothetical protein